MTITDFTEQEGDSQVLQWYKKLMNQINEIDETLDASSESATKIKFRNELVGKYENDWKRVADAIETQFAAMELERLTANLYGLLKVLNKYKENSDEWLEKEVEAQPKAEVTEQISDDEKKKLAEARSALAKQVKTIVEMAVTFNESDAEHPWQLPKKRGAVGKRGPRALTAFTWTIDGEPIDEDNDSVKGVSELVGYAKAADFTQALRDAGINTKEPGNKIEITLNGKVVEGHPGEEEEVTEEEVA